MEIRAVWKSLVYLGETINGCHLKIGIDNTTAVACLKKGGSTSSISCNQETRRVLEYCLDNNITLFPYHCPGKFNIQADKASRWFQDSKEWSLDIKIFEEITRDWGTPEIDLFASPFNSKCKKFVSLKACKEAWKVDAFSLSWENLYCYIFPPFRLIGKTIQKEYCWYRSGST